MQRGAVAVCHTLFTNTLFTKTPLSQKHPYHKTPLSQTPFSQNTLFTKTPCTPHQLLLCMFTPTPFRTLSKIPNRAKERGFCNLSSIAHTHTLEQCLTPLVCPHSKGAPLPGSSLQAATAAVARCCASVPGPTVKSRPSWTLSASASMRACGVCVCGCGGCVKCGVG